MSEIKLPVHAYEQVGHGGLLWSVRDTDNLRIAVDLFEGQAKQIVLALNLHDDLITSLKRRMIEIGRHSYACKCQDCEVLHRAENTTAT